MARCAALLLLPCSASAHPGDAGAYLIYYGYPWALVIFGLAGLAAFWRARRTGEWNIGQRLLVGLGLGLEGMVLLFANPFHVIPLVVGPYQLMPVLAYAAALAMLLANVALLLIRRPAPRHVIYFTCAMAVGILVARVTLIERETAYHLNPGAQGVRKSWR